MGKNFFKYIRKKLKFNKKHCALCDYILFDSSECGLFFETLHEDEEIYEALRCKKCINFFGEYND